MENEQAFISQEWPFEPGERTVRMHLETPAAGITANTGLMLVLHNWGGRYNEPHYVAWCREFADRYNVIAASVNYLQSGDQPAHAAVQPYDFGYLQGIDGLRALHSIGGQLRAAGTPFNPRRCYAMGGSGGGNVALMVAKLAPHTFACIIDICGMPGLTDGIAYGLRETGTSLNAGYSRDPASPAFLARHMQEIRDPGFPAHLAIQFKANSAYKAVIVHGLDDTSCPAVDKIRIFHDMVAAGFRPDGHFLTAAAIDGKAVTTTGHPVGNRMLVVERFADVYLREDGALALAVPGPNDFERKQDVVYPVSGGRYIVDYSHGPPTIRFVAD